MTLSAAFLKAKFPGMPTGLTKQAERIAKEVLTPFSYLAHPPQWRVLKSYEGGSYVKWKGTGRRMIRVILPIRYRDRVTSRQLVAHIEGIITRGDRSKDNGDRTIQDYDFKLLSSLVNAAVDALKVVGRANEVSATLYDSIIEELPTIGIARALENSCKLACDLYSILRNLIDLSNLTYENQRMAYGIIFVDGKSTTGRFPDDVRGNKRFLRLSDGITTAVVLNKSGYIEGLIGLPRSIEPQRGRGFYRPRWLDPLASVAHENQSLGLALTRNGDLHIIDSGKYVASRRKGKWIVWNHSENVALLQDLTTATERDKEIIRTLYRVALDLSSKRSGGLLVWLGEDEGVLETLVPAKDRIGDPSRGPADEAIDRALGGIRISGKLDRSVLVDLASLDGSVVFSPYGEVLAYGSVLNLLSDAGGQSQGARTRAAYSASTTGLAIKVSSDGDITAYFDEEEVLTL